MKRKVSPTQMTMAYLRARGVPCEVTERFVKAGRFGIRIDVWGGDLQALTKEHTINIQAGMAQHLAEKIAKAKEVPGVREWLQSPHRLFQIWVWKKRPHYLVSGKRAKVDRWVPAVRQLSINPVDGEIEAVEFVLSSSASPPARRASLPCGA